MTNEEQEDEVARQARLDLLNKRVADLDLESLAIGEKDLLALATLQLVEQVATLDKHLTVQKISSDRTKRVATFNTIGLFFSLAALSVALFVSIQNHNVVGCLKDWSQKVTDRNQALSDTRSSLDDATDSIFRSLTQPNFQKSFSLALANYFQASDDYQQVRDENPVPPSPELTC